MSAFRSFRRKPFRAQGLNVADVKLMQSSRMVCYISLLPAWRFDHASVNTRPSDQRQMWSTKSDFTNIHKDYLHLITTGIYPLNIHFCCLNHRLISGCEGQLGMIPLQLRSGHHHQPRRMRILSPWRCRDTKNLTNLRNLWDFRYQWGIPKS